MFEAILQVCNVDAVKLGVVIVVSQAYWCRCLRLAASDVSMITGMTYKSNPFSQPQPPIGIPQKVILRAIEP
jgi:hypothetical protein